MGTRSAPQWTDVYLDEDVSFSMESNSPIWNDNAVFSEGLTISVEANRRIFGNSDELRGESIYAMIYHRQFRLWVSGVVFQTGIIDLDDEIEIDVDGMLEITLQGGQKEFDDILKDVNAQDVPIYTPGAADNVQIGYTTDTDYIKVRLEVEEKYLEAHPVKYKSTDAAKALSTNKTYDNVFITMPHVLRNVYAWGYYFTQTGHYKYQLRPEATSGSDDLTNTSLPYPTKPFCNVRLCHPRYSETGGSWQVTYEDRKKGPQCHEAWMLNSAPCFFVHYWIERLFKALGIAVDQDDLSSVPDFDRLAFYHTNAEYEMEKDTDGRHFVFPYPEMRDFDGTKSWLETSLSRMSSAYDKCSSVMGNDSLPDKIHKKAIEDYLQEFIGLSLTIDSSPIVMYPKTITRPDGTTFENDKKGRRWRWRKELTVKSVSLSGDAPALYKAYATGRNFPDAEAAAIIEGIEKGFCVRFIYDSSASRVRIVYLKDVLGTLDVTPFLAIPSDRRKRENDVRGVRLKYGASEKAKRNGITKVDDLTGQQTGVDSDNSGVATSFNYNDYTQLRPFNEYAKVIADIGCTDQTLKYVTTTGNKYRIKVEEGAKTDLELWPSLFEVGGFSDVELGDCSDDDFVEEISIGFSPMIENDANYHNEREAVAGSMDSANADAEDDMEEADDNADFSTPSIKPIYASFVDAELHPAQPTLSYLTFDKCFSSDAEGYPHRKSDSVRKFQMKTVVTGGVWLDEHYNIEQSANSPYYQNDTGFTLGILRESPDEDGIIVYDYNYDGKGNSKWRYVSNKDGCFTSDSIDHFGNALCHHDGKASMSLKLRVETRNPYWDEQTKTCSRYEDITDLNTGFFLISDSNNARRGLYDLVYADYCYWLLHRKVAVFTFERGTIELGELLSIDYCKKYRIDGIEGFINKVSYDFDMNGLNSATIELYYL